MKVLKIIGIIVLVILLIGLGIVLFGPSEVHMQRQITIDAPASDVYREVSGFKTFDKYSAWAGIDTTAIMTVEGPASGVGAKYTWDSEDPSLGKGGIVIIETVPNQLVRSEMQFDGYPGKPIASWTLTEEGGTTTVSYGYDEEGISGIMKIFSLGTSSMLGPKYDETLAKLKERGESKPDFAYTMDEFDAKASAYVGVKATSTPDPDAISQAMGDAYGLVNEYMMKNNIEMAGPPISIVLSYDETSTSMICGMPTASLLEVESEIIMSGETYAGMTVKTIHKGDYALMEAAYQDIVEYMAYYNLEQNGDPWEVYVTDPGNVPDTAEWITEIYFPFN